jgi:glycolate oxidase subunit GlcD
VPHTLVTQLADIVGTRWVKHRSAELVAFDADALPGYRATPLLAVFPGTRDELVRVVQLFAREGIPFVPRGAGTGLSGGALADGTALLGLNRLTRILNIDQQNRIAHVEPGVVNAKLSRAVAPMGLQYAPDPSSQTVCTIGGNVAENAGGPHCLKYGVTLNHIVALNVVLPSGECVQLGDPFNDSDGLDLLGLFVGSEGCFGVATDVWVKLVPLPRDVRTLLADFHSLDDAAKAVSAIVATGIVPAALEMMDNPTIRAVEASIYSAGYPVDAAAVLLCEVDGLTAGLHEDVETITQCCRNNGARDVRVAQTDTERTKLWQGRKKAFGAMGRIAPALVVQDAVVPRTKLPDILRTIAAIGEEHQVTICNVFHAGDGNLHPNIPYNPDDTDASHRVHNAMRAVMKACMDIGGTITGEHGVGLDKLDYMPSLFSEHTLATMCAVREVFDPDRRSNPGKVVPVKSCREWHAVSGTKDSRRITNSNITANTNTNANSTSTANAHTTAAGSNRIRAASANDVPVRITGASTWRAAGRPLPDLPVRSSLAHSGVIQYVPGDLVITVGAGTSLGEIAQVTAQHGQWLPLEPYTDCDIGESSGHDAGTIGATVATSSFGPLALGFGRPRDMVLGLTAVNAAGRELRVGGQVVKNVAGFDLVRLLTGSWGTLGMITEVSVRLHARPIVDETFVVAINVPGSDWNGHTPHPFHNTLAQLVDQLNSAPLLASTLSLAACVVLPATTARVVCTECDIPTHGLLLMARATGNRTRVTALQQALTGLGNVTAIGSDIWRHLRMTDVGNTTWRLSNAPMQLADTFGEAARWCHAAGVGDHATIILEPMRGAVRVSCTLPESPIGNTALPHRAVVERIPTPWWPTIPLATNDRLSEQLRQVFRAERAE